MVLVNVAGVLPMRGQRLRKIFGGIAVITGAALLITSMPSWIWMMITGGLFIWFGYILFFTNR